MKPNYIKLRERTFIDPVFDSVYCFILGSTKMLTIDEQKSLLCSNDVEDMVAYAKEDRDVYPLKIKNSRHPIKDAK